MIVAVWLGEGGGAWCERKKKGRLKLVQYYLWKIITCMPNLLCSFKMTQLPRINLQEKYVGTIPCQKQTPVYNGLFDIHSYVVKLVIVICLYPVATHWL
jgi:hypothetical protein